MVTIKDIEERGIGEGVTEEELEVLCKEVLWGDDIGSVVSLYIALRGVRDIYRVYGKYYSKFMDKMGKEILGMGAEEIEKLDKIKALIFVTEKARNDDLAKLSIKGEVSRYIEPCIRNINQVMECFKVWEVERIARFFEKRYVYEREYANMEDLVIAIRVLPFSKTFEIQVRLCELSDKFVSYAFAIKYSKELVLYILRKAQGDDRLFHKVCGIIKSEVVRRDFDEEIIKEILLLMLKSLQNHYDNVSDVIIELYFCYNLKFLHFLEEGKHIKFLCIIFESLIKLKSSAKVYNVLISEGLYNLVIESGDEKFIILYCRLFIDLSLRFVENFDFNKLQQVVLSKVRDKGFIQRFYDYFIHNGDKGGEIDHKGFRRRFNILALNDTDREERTEKRVILLREQKEKLEDIIVHSDEDEEARSKAITTLQLIEFEEQLILLKDFFFITLILITAQDSLGGKQRIENCDILWEYLKEKNKKLIDIYHELFKNNIGAYYETLKLQKDIKFWDEGIGMAAGIFYKLAGASANFGEYLRLLNKLKVGLKLIHDSGISEGIIEAAILNKQFNLDEKNNQDFLEINEEIGEIGETNYLEEIVKFNNLMKQAKPEAEEAFISVEEFNKYYAIYLELYNKFRGSGWSDITNGSDEYVAINKLHTYISMMGSMKMVMRYLPKAKPKNGNLFILNGELLNGIRFRVLKFLDPYAFSVGADTGCCQRIGGEGEAAAVDSFINPLAGVLVCEYKGMIISQSYFHFVPDDFGFILDNVEWNKVNAKRLGISQEKLSKIYSEYVKLLIEKNPKIKYIKCGKGHNKLENHLFEKSEMEVDPRHFEHDEKYSDFKRKDHIDLTKPRGELGGISIEIKQAAGNRRREFIKISQLRRMWVEAIINSDNNSRLEKLASIFEGKSWEL